MSNDPSGTSCNYPANLITNQPPFLPDSDRITGKTEKKPEKKSEENTCFTKEDCGDIWDCCNILCCFCSIFRSY
ncbi:Cysteine-rich transmembrane CYSTM domain-containing protein [Caenorhabditis elegans]|uniref:Cysteine-rich transmembrane CYSTM domain-containing protein n=1 Tax=Caenorhabditis elegans TaxID=6239 RepID=H2L2J2_CAEEL|nr:Cysteine-rich transmembrane CYSTM domain-containing protein [Caenorhabditis elegans]CCE71799.1 Cysteine-rich transmembrane CYSTM domain-containing protein [Caenorhabditis elegans]|eukprot:NP_001256722.1 Uncharacterized protein CELE_W06G6.11 [Caenorhabditis elegans]